jgi:hypothetical protein
MLLAGATMQRLYRTLMIRCPSWRGRAGTAASFAHELQSLPNDGPKDGHLQEL